MVKKIVSSSNFTYEDVEAKIQCDGSIQPKLNKSTFGWAIYDSLTDVLYAEGRGFTNTILSTTEIELISIFIALSEAIDMHFNSIILETDYDGIGLIQNNTNQDINQNVVSVLDEFHSWQLEKIDRKNITRAHKLAASVSDEKYAYECELPHPTRSS